MSNINLLPWRLENIIYKNYIFAAMCGAIGILAIILAIIINIMINIMINDSQNNIKYLNSEISTYKSKITEINGLKERKKILLNRWDIINSLEIERSVVVNILDKVAISVPSGILLKEMSIKEGILNIVGKSESNTRVSVFMRNLEKFPLFSNPRLKQIKSSQDNKVEQFVGFELEVNFSG